MVLGRALHCITDLIEVMGDAFVEAASGRHSHGVIHVDNIALVPHHFKFSIPTVQREQERHISVFQQRDPDLQAQTAQHT